jgi:hypothetical protein
MDNSVNALAILPGGDLVAGGRFTAAGPVSASRIARWDGAAWSPLGAGVNGSVNALAVVPGGDLAIGGEFTSAGGAVCAFLAQWREPVSADFNRSGSVTVQDIFDFLGAYFTQDPEADVNHSGSVSVQDVFDYLAAYFTGCD